MSFEIKTYYFDDVTALTHAWRVHTEGRNSEWHGAYAAVYDLGDRVMKLSGGDDLGYLSYLETMAELKLKNRYLPVIHSVDYYRFTDEARKEHSMFRHREKIVTYMEKLQQPPKHFRRTYDANGNLLNMSKPPLKIWAARVENYVQFKMTDEFHALSLEHQEAIVLLKIAHEHYATKYSTDYGRLDLHAGNVLARGKTFVITDPFA